MKNTGANNKRYKSIRINTYLDCRLKHYFSYILGIKEPKTTIESIEPNDFGAIFHQYEKLFMNLLKKS
jgi:ATP-dependent helicase/DNAse subunit B